MDVLGLNYFSFSSAFWLQPEFTQNTLKNATPGDRSRPFNVIKAAKHILDDVGKRPCRINSWPELQKTAETHEVYDDKEHAHNLNIMA